jgi:hypothetical protein
MKPDALAVDLDGVTVDHRGDASDVGAERESGFCGGNQHGYFCISRASALA